MSKELVENCRYIDISDVIKEYKDVSLGLKEQGVSFVWNIASVDEKGNKQAQDIYFGKAQLKFGERPYFLCVCGGRCSRLYLALRGSFFRCKTCADLVYASQAKKGNPIYELSGKYIKKLQKLEEKINKKGIRWSRKLKLQERYDALYKEFKSSEKLLKAKIDAMGIVRLLDTVVSCYREG